MISKKRRGHNVYELHTLFLLEYMYYPSDSTFKTQCNDQQIGAE